MSILALACRKKPQDGPYGIVLAPSRELVIQIEEEAQGESGLAAALSPVLVKVFGCAFAPAFTSSSLVDLTGTLATGPEVRCLLRLPDGKCCGWQRC